MGRTVTKAELSEILGLSLPTIESMVRRGCPWKRKGSKGRAYQFDTADVIAWRETRIREDRAAEREAQVINLERERALKTAAERRLAELELAQRSGELVHVDDVAARIESEYANVRARLLLIPTKLAPRIARMRKAAEARAAIHAEVREALHELSTADELTRDVAGGEPAARAEPDEGAGAEPPASA